jgi:LysR family transcriptional regulator, regulator for genes of the gallate degradation pathway
MELRQLERFLAVTEGGSLAAAARRLGLTQQALSASIASLEADLGVRLFDRSPGGVTRPTAAGQAFLRHARSQLAAAARAREELRDLGAGHSGTVTIGIGESFAGDIIAEAVTLVRQQHPEIRINLIEGYSEDLRHRLYDGEFDFIAAGVSAYDLAPGFKREMIYSADDVVVARPEHPLAGRKGLQLRDLQGFAWLVPYSRAADFALIVEAFAAEELEPPRRAIGSDAYRIGMHLLLASDLLLMVSPALIGPELGRSPPTLRVLDIDRPTVRRNASLVYPADRPVSPAAQWLLEAVRDGARRYRNLPEPRQKRSGGRVRSGGP